MINGKEWTLIRASKNLQIKWGKWLADRCEAAVMETAEKYRKRARQLNREAHRLQDEIEADVEPPIEEKNRLLEEYNDVEQERMFLENESKEIIQTFHDRKGAGEFDYHGNVGVFMAQRGFPGRFYLAWLVCQEHHPGTTIEEIADAHANHVEEWSDLLFRSQGVDPKNVEEPPPSTPIKKKQEATSETDYSGMEDGETNSL